MSAFPLFAQQAAAIRGVVRDAQGTPQMGAVVQLLGADARLIASAFTDLNGRYQMRDLVPGNYQLRVTGTLFLPSMRTRLRLRPGDLPTINVMLIGLLDRGWLPAGQRRDLDEPDDWQWTLRSSANRPLLRVFEDGSANPDGEVEKPAALVKVRRTIAIDQAEGAFGESGTRLVVQERRSTGDRLALANARGAMAASGSGAAAVDLATIFEGRSRTGTVHRVAVHFESRPQIALSPQNSGFAAIDVMAGQQFAIGDSTKVEAGTLVRALRSEQSVVSSFPFLRVDAKPSAGWAAGYLLATSADCQGLDDFGRTATEVPAAARVANRLQQEQGLHQAVYLRRGVGRATIKVTAEHDALRRVALRGAWPRAHRPSSALRRQERLDGAVRARLACRRDRP